MKALQFCDNHDNSGATLKVGKRKGSAFIKIKTDNFIKPVDPIQSIPSDKRSKGQ